MPERVDEVAEAAARVRWGRPDRSKRPCPMRLAACDRPAHGRLRLAAGPSPSSRSPCSSTRRRVTRAPDALARPSRDRPRPRGPRCLPVRAAGPCRRRRGTSSSSTTRSLTWPWRTRDHPAPPAAGAVPAGADRGARAAGSLTSGYLAPFRVDERIASPRIRGGSPPAAEVTPVLHELRDDLGAARPRRIGTWPTRRCAARWRWSTGTGEPAPGWPRPARRRTAGSRSGPVLAYVDRHCRESITLDHVAEVVHVSPSRVRHVFKDVTGVSFKEYVTQVRVAEAKRLLLGTDLSVAEVARCRQLHEPAPVLQGLLPLLRDVARGVPPLLHPGRRRGRAPARRGRAPARRGDDDRRPVDRVFGAGPIIRSFTNRPGALPAPDLHGPVGVSSERSCRPSVSSSTQAPPETSGA